MAKTIVYDKQGNPTSAESVDAREMIKSGNYAGEAPKGKKVTLADVETLPGEPQYPPTAQPEHPLPTPHQVLVDSVTERQGAHKRGDAPKVQQQPGFDKDGKQIQPVTTGQPFPVPPNAPAFANQSKPAVPAGSPGDSADNRTLHAPDKGTDKTGQSRVEGPVQSTSASPSGTKAEGPANPERAGIPHAEGGTPKGTVQGGQPTVKHDAK